MLCVDMICADTYMCCLLFHDDLVVCFMGCGCCGCVVLLGVVAWMMC